MQIKPSIPARLSDAVVLGALALLQFAFVFGLPWLDSGLWPQTEGPGSAIHFLSTIICVTAGWRLAVRDERYIAAFMSPVVLALFAFALFSAAVAPFSQDVARTFQGTLKHGVGVIWHFELALTVFAVAALWNSACYRLSLVASTVVAVLIVLILYLIPDGVLGVPLAFAEWTGMLALAVSGSVLVASARAIGYRRVFLCGLAFAVFAAGYLVSDNRAVMLAAAAVGGLLVSARLPILRAVVSIPLARAAIVTCTAVSLTAGVYVAGPIIENRAMRNVGSSDFPSVASVLPVDKAHVQDTALGTVWSRSYMVRILVDDIIERPVTALTGNGFGSFATSYEHHARDVPGRFFADASMPTASTTFWDVHSSANFHSHNMLAETVASVGLLGAIVWLGIFAAMAWTSLGGAAVALGIVVVGSFWFPVNHMIGCLALAFGPVAIPRRHGGRVATFASGFGPLIAILGAAALGYTAVASAYLGRVERAERGFPAVQVDSNLDSCGFIRTRAFPEKEVVIDLYTVLNNRIARSENPARELFDRSTNVISINCMLRRYYERDGSVRALTASLSGRTSLVALGKSSYGPLRNEIISWGDDIDLLLSLAPERTEFLPPYVALLGARAPEKALAEIDRFVPRLDDSDPVRHYLLAQRAKRTGDDPSYRTHLSRALELGFANLWPVSEAEAKRVRDK